MISNAVFGKTMEDVSKNIDIKLVRNEDRRNYLVSEPNHDMTKFFSDFFFFFCNRNKKNANIHE